MSEIISKDEYLILKKFMRSEDFSLSQDKFDELYPRGSEIRISAVRLYHDKLLTHPEILENNEVVGYKSEYSITKAGRFAYKSYKDFVKQKRHDIVVDKAIDFTALVVAIIALLKSFESEISTFFKWCMKLLEQ